MTFSGTLIRPPLANVSMVRASVNRYRIAFQLLQAAFHVSRGRKLRKLVRGDKVVVPLVSPKLISAMGEGDGAAAFPAVESAPHRVLRRDEGEPGAPVCLFVSFAPDGRIWPHTRAYLQALRRSGLHTVLIAATERPDLRLDDPGPEAADAVIVKRNGGYDFACWALALKLMPELWAAPALYFVNDSVYGPLSGFNAMMARIAASPADVIGLTESDDIAYHLQSYFLVLKGAALASPAIRGFWAGVREIESKHRVVKEYEVPLAGVALSAGLRVEAMFPMAAPGAPRINPTLFLWRELIEAGFPFMKAHLLRENLSGRDLTGWRELVARHGGDVEAIALHLGGVSPRAPGLSAG
ncbi:MAG: rhamnan synthesis F family protein [Hyphomicrobiales bacterium]|nr:rhamnan synthesis F family protein [Hyphomicrobiales bacterium]